MFDSTRLCDVIINTGVLQRRKRVYLFANVIKNQMNASVLSKKVVRAVTICKPFLEACLFIGRSNDIIQAQVKFNLKIHR